MPDPEKTTAVELIEEQAESRIRREWHDERWFFSVIDVIGLLTDSANPRNYWNMLKSRMSDEGARETYTKCVRLSMKAADGKMRATDAADTETLLRIIQSIPSPKAEPIKQWLARVGARRLDEVTQPLPPHASTASATIAKPDEEAPAFAWAEYYERLAALYRRQAAYEARLMLVEARQDNLEDRMECVEEVSRLVPEILERLGPLTLLPEHQATVKALAGRLHDLAGIGYATIYGDLNQSFHVARYADIEDASWPDVATWFQQRIAAAEKRRAC
jgi:BRO family, N-terminal domain